MRARANTRDVRTESTAMETGWWDGEWLGIGRDETEMSATRGRKDGLRRWRWTANTLAVGQQPPARMHPSLCARPPPSRTPSPLDPPPTRSSTPSGLLYMRNTTPLAFASSPPRISFSMSTIFPTARHEYRLSHDLAHSRRRTPESCAHPRGESCRSGARVSLELGARPGRDGRVWQLKGRAGIQSS